MFNLYCIVGMRGRNGLDVFGDRYCLRVALYARLLINSHTDFSKAYLGCWNKEDSAAA